MIRVTRWISLSAFAAALCVAVGCGEKTGEVSGKVTYKGKTVVSGSVMILPDNGGLPKYGMISEDGSYKVTDVATGPAKITVSSPNPAGGRSREVEAGQEEGGIGRGGGGRGRAGGEGAAQQQAPPADAPKGWFPIPEFLGDPEKSGLQVTVTPGAMTHNIDIK